MHYQHALKNFITQIYCLRLLQPTLPIMVHADDIDAVFQHILYHPDTAIAFSYVLDKYLIVPIGQVFGS